MQDDNYNGMMMQMTMLQQQQQYILNHLQLLQGHYRYPNSQTINCDSFYPAVNMNMPTYYPNLPFKIDKLANRTTSSIEKAVPSEVKSAMKSPTINNSKNSSPDKEIVLPDIDYGHLRKFYSSTLNY